MQLSDLQVLVHAFNFAQPITLAALMVMLMIGMIQVLLRRRDGMENVALALMAIAVLQATSYLLNAPASEAARWLAGGAATAGAIAKSMVTLAVGTIAILAIAWITVALVGARLANPRPIRDRDPASWEEALEALDDREQVAVIDLLQEIQQAIEAGVDEVQQAKLEYLSSEVAPRAAIKLAKMPATRRGDPGSGEENPAREFHTTISAAKEIARRERLNADRTSKKEGREEKDRQLEAQLARSQDGASV